jgi:alpha-galactosidase
MSTSRIAIVIASICLLTLLAPAYADTVWLDTLEMDQAIQTWGQPQRNLSDQRTPITIAGKMYSAGLGVQTRSVIWIDLGYGAGRFKADVGVDDTSQGSAKFAIGVDGATVWSSGLMKNGDEALPVDIDVNGKRYMTLVVEGPSNGVNVDWANAHWDTQWSAPIEARAERNAAYVLTPPIPDAPRLNNALRYGARPGDPFEYTIPCTGKRPIDFSATGLPDGLTLDTAEGRIVGMPKRPGTFEVGLTATNALGVARRPLEIVIGDQLALTPPMGWSSWNAWCAAPSQDRVLAAAESMVKFDLIDHGFAYVNIDDGWQGLRGGKYNGIQPNEKFPNFPAMLAQIHELGLKLGVYSGPWICSYCGYTGGSSDDPTGAWSPALRNLPDNGWVFGKYSFAQNDAQEWASWGIDYLKYDWYPTNEPQVALMSDALRGSGRNIVYSVSNSASLDKGPMLMRYAQLWRASGDIRDNWPSLYNNGFSQSAWASYSGPGHWADPDMMVLGDVGFGSDWGSKTHPSLLTPDEQYTHISLWCLLAAPLILGCDMTKLDPFTVGLLTNDEVIAVDQDPLGKPATRVAADYFHEVWMRPLYDGSYAVGIFNIAPGTMTYKLPLSNLQISGHFSVRDLWRQEDLGTYGDTFETEIPGHGVRLLRLSPVGAGRGP